MPSSGTRDKTEAAGEVLLDRRRHVFRPDLAQQSLRGRVVAERFAAGELYQVVEAVVPLRRSPDASAPIDSELVRGELVDVYEFARGWAWVQAHADGYVGYVPENCLGQPAAAATHKVAALATHVYRDADIKSPPLARLVIGSQLSVSEPGAPFSQLAEGGWVASRHIAPIGQYSGDFVAVAERFVGIPYLWGGRTSLGIDCSGLVQVSLGMSGINAPRDSDMQQLELGEEIGAVALTQDLARGDLVFWRGHVGIMCDGVRLIHANAHHMAVAVEPLSDTVERAARADSPIVSIRRIATANS